uniref:Tetratricopeptide TPR_2 repeat protein n=1 Tax=Solibacter usitatus (strain Ellin6076) TaxID=234267 RepID=Q02B52_SOLUE
MKKLPNRVLKLLGALPFLLGCGWCQAPGLGVPSIAAQTKGPDQINLTWAAVSEPGYGYLVEIQSAADSRYASWTELQPIPQAAGYTCDSTIFVRGARCEVSDPTGVHVYNPPTRGVAPWVTDPSYIDPQDNSPAQFIAWGLKPNTAYSFRVRSYSGQSSPTYGSYSNTVAAKTADYPARYVSPTGKDTNDGKASDAAHAWHSLAHGARSLACGQVLIVMGGTYTSDEIRMGQACTAEAKAVVLVNPGETATLISQPNGSPHAVTLGGRHVVIDGLHVASSGVAEGEYDVEIQGHYNALLNVEAHPPVIPSFKFGVTVGGSHNLFYRCYLHDYGSPDPTQNPNGGGGFLLTLLGGGATENVIWSNHLTRGGHDESICKAGCRGNRWLNNVMDGGWGQGWIGAFGTVHNLVEGNVIKSVGQLVPYFKPAIQISSAQNTVRRNVVLQSRTWALEISSFDQTASNNLVYNNVFYRSGGCYFQSSSRGVRAYYNDIYANNICYRIQNLATQIYVGNTTNRIVSNDFLFVDGTGKPQPEHPLVIWNQLAAGAFETTRPIGGADRTYDPPFSRNRSLSVPPQFVDEANLDFHLAPGSPLVAAGLPLANLLWGSSTGAVDLGAFGLNVTTMSDWPTDAAMERARAGDYEAALTIAKPPSAALEAALLRASDDDGGAAAALARIGAPAPEDLMARFERARQGTADPALWGALAAAPDRTLEMADLYLQWGLTRDALELLAHDGPNGPPSGDALFVYYRSYCREELDYQYYAAEDLRLAATLPLKDVSPKLKAALTVLQSASQRNPVDAYAHYLMGLLHRNAGRPAAARDALENALIVRPGFPQAEALLAKLPPATESRRKVRQAAPATLSSEARSPVAIAAMALRIAASADIDGAMSYFIPSNFPGEKQDDAVREAYLELRLRRLMASAAAKQCGGAAQSIANLGVADKQLPFTAGGFDALIGGARVQYLLGVVEFTCGDQQAARTRWDRVSKADAGIASTDYAYPILALAKLEPAVATARSRTAMGFLARQLGSAAPAHLGALQYSQGLLQALTGKQADAMSSFRSGAEAGPAGMVEYLNLEAIRALEAGQ